jgi:hypothetical protein
MSGLQVFSPLARKKVETMTVKALIAWKESLSMGMSQTSLRIRADYWSSEVIAVIAL